jgi:hypothetical protein
MAYWEVGVSFYFAESVRRREEGKKGMGEDSTVDARMEWIAMDEWRCMGGRRAGRVEMREKGRE